MPKIYDNIELQFAHGLKQHISVAKRVDYCAGYFNIRGWKTVCDQIDLLDGMPVEENEETVVRYCRLLVGMTKLPLDTIIDELDPRDGSLIDQKKANALKKQLATELRKQLTVGTPTNEDEKTIQHLLKQLKSGKVVIKLFLRHQLHAKLYLAYSKDTITDKLALVGSSNFTFSGLQNQGELNVDVLEQDAATKLAKWFDDRWNDRWSIDITKELIKVIEESWAREESIPPYNVYLKMAYHLSQEARTGISEFKLPREFERELLDFQQKAVLIAAHHLNKRNGVMVGDVVGLGKTMVASAIAKIMEDDIGFNTLILCPKNLEEMWRGYVEKYGLHARILSHSMVKELRNLRRYRLVIIDESHNFRNSENKTYKMVKSYIEDNDSKVVLLSATPYNKSYQDLASQLKLFLPEDYDLGISPEHYINKLGGVIQFHAKHTDTHIRSINAFEKSDCADDWRELMKQYLVRRTRSFIKANYAQIDLQTGRKYIEFANGQRSYFPDRIPKKVEFALNLEDKTDEYARLYGKSIVQRIDDLELPRYSLLDYIKKKEVKSMNSEEAALVEGLSRAGRRTRGFCRTNLYKRLESSGYAFLLSVSRLILRNYIVAYAVENNLPVPVGGSSVDVDFYSDVEDDELLFGSSYFGFTKEEYQAKAKDLYQEFSQNRQSNFKWMRAQYFDREKLSQALNEDNISLLSILKKVPEWHANQDRKLQALAQFITDSHKNEKILVFTQFADTANYLFDELKKLGIDNIGVAVGGSENISDLVKQFSPKSNKTTDVNKSNELRVLISTDVLSEGQNLQDSHIVVNFDLPWALIRLIQRAGRVDRLGQEAEQILCYSFLPEDGIEKIIGLRKKLKKRIKDNAEVVGSDEVFFDGDPINISDLYSEKAGIFDEQDDTEVDLASYAYQIWKNAIDQHPELKNTVSNLPDVVFSTKSNTTAKNEDGVVVYARTYEGNDVMTWLDANGQIVTQSQFAILKAAECDFDCAVQPRLENHHKIVKQGIELISTEERNATGTLGRKTGVKYKTYMRMSRYLEENEGTIFITDDNKRALDDIYKYPIKEYARDVISRQLKAGISDEQLVELVTTLMNEDRLCNKDGFETEHKLTQIICSLGLRKTED
ncbi:MAG: NgoFVII family restriction endonuclease [Clostridiales bacterium]|nr:NgoFVII family restriction endonuclease [Clostridiales bacterium]